VSTARPPAPSAAAGADVIVVDGLRAAYGDRVILEDVSFRVGERQTLAVVGPSGCGKSTLLRCLVGLLPPAGGRITILGQDIAQLDRHDLDELRRRFGVAFQGSALLNSMTIADNVALPLREHTRLDEHTIRIMTRLKLEQVGLGEAADKLPSELSGGMRKRAGIARALAMDPQVLFLDEPSAGLDPITAAGLDNLLDKLRTVLGLTLIVITHELESIRHVADRVLMLDEGRVRLDGTLQQAMTSRDPRVRQFFDRRADTEPAPGGDYVDDLGAPEEQP
jgi:phospholipid/cholesterol/gamma-HCH transport system ATP-binding protein